MRKNKSDKKVFNFCATIIVILVVIVAVMAYGTMAYFTASKSITNNFLVVSTEEAPPTPPNPDNVNVYGEAK